MGGHVEDNENIFDAAVREAKEELGIDVKASDLKPLFSMQVSPDHVYFYFRCDKFEGNPTNMEPDQCDDLRFFDVNNLPENIIPADKKALEEIYGKEPQSFATFGWGE
jgi:ADP-ribose pyrophosphatase YjhB (NUDIX family)